MIDQINAELTLLRVAAAHDWVRETNGPNRGEIVDQIIKTTGLDPATRPPWCACFVAYIGRMVLGAKPADGGWPLKPWAGCQSLHAEANGKGLVRLASARGAVFLLWSDKLNRFHHTGFVGDPVAGGMAFNTVEGNTSPDGSPEGTGVFLRTRTFKASDRFIWWWLPQEVSS